MNFKLEDGRIVQMTLVETTLRRDLEYKKSRLYISEVGENLADNLMNRRNRPYELYKKVIPEAVEALLEEKSLDCKELFLTKESFSKLKWSQKAGCSCGCSPGFILGASEGLAIWFDIKVKILKQGQRFK